MELGLHLNIKMWACVIVALPDIQCITAVHGLRCVQLAHQRNVNVNQWKASMAASGREASWVETVGLHISQPVCCCVLPNFLNKSHGFGHFKGVCVIFFANSVCELSQCSQHCAELPVFHKKYLLIQTSAWIWSFNKHYLCIPKLKYNFFFPQSNMEIMCTCNVQLSSS